MRLLELRLWRILVTVFLVLAIPVSAYDVYRDAGIAWPHSWALTERWPWWFHVLALAGQILLLVSMWERKPDHGGG